MRLHEKCNGVAIGEKREVMSIGFCFLSLKSEKALHTYPRPRENRNFCSLLKWYLKTMRLSSEERENSVLIKP
jgi:hypothetical protein